MDTSNLPDVLCYAIPILVLLVLAGIKIASLIKVDAFQKRGDKAFLAGDYELAGAQYSQALKYRASRAHFQLRLGLLQYVQKEFSKAGESFASALASQPAYTFAHVESLCKYFKVDPDENLAGFFQKAESRSLDLKFEELAKDLEAKKALSIHFWGETEKPNFSPHDTRMLLLGKDASRTRVARAVMGWEPQGQVKGTAGIETTAEGKRITVNFLHQVEKIGSSPNDHFLTLTPGESVHLNDESIAGMMNRWRIGGEDEVLSACHKDINRALAIIITHLRKWRDAGGVPEIVLHLQWIMPVYWHESIARKETLSGTEWTYSLHQWRHLVSLETGITLDPAAWKKGYFDFSKENRNKLTENSRVQIVGG